MRQIRPHPAGSRELKERGDGRITSLFRRHWVAITLITITLIGLALRLYQLDFQCLAADEIKTYTIVSTKTIPGILAWALGSDYNPPLFYIISKISALAFGTTTIFSIRFPDVILGTLAIPVAYLLGNETEGVWSGIITAIFIAASFPFIYYSQNARAYMLILVAFMAFTLYFIRLYRGDTSRKTITITAILAVLCLWSHFYSIIPLCVMLIFLSKKYSGILKKYVWIVVLLCLPFVYYIPVVINHLANFQEMVHDQYWLSPFSIATITPFELFGQGCLILLIFIGYSVITHRDKIYDILFVTGLITILSCIPMAWITAMSPRYALLVSPLLFIVAIYPVVNFIRTRTFQQQIVIVIGITYFICITNYGSLLSFWTFNICPYV
jgi:uncharacterized membrane protein